MFDFRVTSSRGQLRLCKHYLEMNDSWWVLYRRKSNRDSARNTRLRKSKELHELRLQVCALSSSDFQLRDTSPGSGGSSPVLSASKGWTDVIFSSLQHWDSKGLPKQKLVQSLRFVRLVFFFSRPLACFDSFTATTQHLVGFLRGSRPSLQHSHLLADNCGPSYRWVGRWCFLLHLEPALQLVPQVDAVCVGHGPGWPWEFPIKAVLHGRKWVWVRGDLVGDLAVQWGGPEECTSTTAGSRTDADKRDTAWFDPKHGCSIQVEYHTTLCDEAQKARAIPSRPIHSLTVQWKT